MQTLTQEKLIEALHSLGIKNGDVLFIFSDLRPFGIPYQRQSRDEILNFYFEAFHKVIGQDGTLIVPAFFYEYGYFGTPFDVDNSPVSIQLGSFSQWFNCLPNRIRSLNPMVSVAALGKYAKDVAGNNSFCAFGEKSPWQKLRELNGKILMFGAPFVTMTYIHYIEQMYGVPHRYFKVFPYPVIKDGKVLTTQLLNYVRFLDYNIKYDLQPFKELLQQKKCLHYSKLNQAELYLVDSRNAYHFGLEALNENPYFFLEKVPDFIPGKIPLDDKTGTLFK